MRLPEIGKADKDARPNVRSVCTGNEVRDWPLLRRGREPPHANRDPPQLQKYIYFLQRMFGGRHKSRVDASTLQNSHNISPTLDSGSVMDCHSLGSSSFENHESNVNSKSECWLVGLMSQILF